MYAKLVIKNLLRENIVNSLNMVANHPGTLPLLEPPSEPMPPYYYLLSQYYSAYNDSYHQLRFPQPPQHAAPSLKHLQYRSSSLLSEFNSFVDKLMDYIA